MIATLALAAALAWPPWQTVAQGSSQEWYPFGHAAFVAGKPAGLSPFIRFLRDEDKVRVATVDLSQKAVVAVLVQARTPCHKLEIVDLRRTRRTLRVAVVIKEPPPGIGCIFQVGQLYDVIAVPRPVIGTPLPRRVVIEARQPTSR